MHLLVSECCDADPWAEITMLAALGADVDARDAEGNTPLHLATNGWSAQHDVEPAVWGLLQVGADATATNDAGLDALGAVLQRLRTMPTYVEPPRARVPETMTMLARASRWGLRRHMLLAIRGRGDQTAGTPSRGPPIPQHKHHIASNLTMN